MDPITIAAGLATFQAINGVLQADIIRQSADLNKQISDLNVAFAEADAQEALRMGMSEEIRYQSVIDKTLGAQKVAFAINEVDASFGTAKQIVDETKLTGLLNQLDIRNKAHANALGFKRQALNYQLQGGLNYQAAQGKAAATQGAGFMNAASTLVMGYLKGGSADLPETSVASESTRSGLGQYSLNYNN